MLIAPTYGADPALFAIPTESSLIEPLSPGAALRIVLYSRDLLGLARILGVAPPLPEARRLEYTLASYPQLSASPGRSWLESTFVVDFLETDVIQLYEKLRQSKGDHPSRQQLVEFVSATMSGSHARGWDIASSVARNRDGDCSEYAVLTAALARSARIKARVVLGIALVSNDHSHAAYGHAWTEVEEKGRWVVADAALSGAAAEIRYIPFAILSDEGPGFTIELVSFTSVWIQRVLILGPATMVNKNGK